MVVSNGMLGYRGAFLSILLLLFAHAVFAQGGTRDDGEDKGTRYRVPDSLAKKPDPKRILLVPYEPNRYNNELEKEMKEATGLRLRQIRKRIRFGLDNELLFALGKERREVISYLREDDPDRNFELKYVYRGLAYSYRPVPVSDLKSLQEGDEEEEKGAVGKLFGGSDDDPSQKKDTGSGRDVMSEGQIKDRPDRRIRFMDAMIRQKEILNYLVRKYGVGYLFFINQLDLMPKKDELVELAAGTHDNIIKAHYTIMDHNGKKVHGGAAFVPYPSKVKDLNGLIKNYFSKVGEEVRQRFKARIGER